MRPLALEDVRMRAVYEPVRRAARRHVIELKRGALHWPPTSWRSTALPEAR